MGMLSKFEEAVLAKVGTYTPEGRTASGRAADCRKVAMCEAKQHGEGQRGACRNWAPSAGPVTSRSLQPQVMVMREATDRSRIGFCLTLMSFPTASLPTDRASKGVHKVLSVKTAANFMALHDHYLMVPEAIAAMEAREEALDHVFSLEEERAHMQHQLESLQQQSGTPQRVRSIHEEIFVLRSWNDEF